jgi:O-antigen/teichoic acid export membrane protein
LKLGVKGVFISALFSSFTVFIVLIFLVLKFVKFVFRKRLFSQMFRFAWPFVPAGFAAAIIQVIDKPMLMFLTDSGTVGIYQANYKFGIFMLLVVAMFAQAWSPFFLEHAKSENAKEMFSKILTYFALCSVWIIFAISLFIGDVIKTPFFGFYLLHPDYWAGIGIIPIILVGYLFYGFYVNFTTAPILSKKTYVLVNVTFIGAAVNVLSNLVLIRFFGMFGAAWASFAGYGVMAFALVIFSNKFYRVPYEWKRIMHLALVSLAMMAFYYFAKTVTAESSKLFLTLKASILIMFPIILFFSGFFTEREIGAVKKRIFKNIGEQ